MLVQIGTSAVQSITDLFPTTELRSSLMKLTMTTVLLAILKITHRNDNANLLIRAIATTVSSFITVDCGLVSCFKDLVGMAPQWPW
jgi:hypothetical protein